MKQLLEEYLSNYERGYKDLHAIRWLCKRDPVLWKKITKATNFLDDPKPKQRCWHIINDVWEYPRCPVTNERVKWWENRYLTYNSISAQNLSPENRKKKAKTMIERYGVEHALQSKEIKKKIADTYMKNHGVTNPSQMQEVKDKIKDTLIENGSWRSDEFKEDQELYNQQVANYTRISWKEYKDKINPNGYERGVRKYHLDHKFPRIRGYVDGIDPEIIGHWSNLQVIHYTENLSKHAKTDMTKEQLLEKFDKYNSRLT